ncbi:hypothetical protein LSH36_1305g00000, partial [Paralvinella palmiformis]
EGTNSNDGAKEPYGIQPMFKSSWTKPAPQPKLCIPLKNCVTNSEAMLLGFIAEKNLHFADVPDLVELIKTLAKEARKTFMACGSYLQLKMPVTNKILRHVSAHDPFVKAQGHALQYMLALPSRATNVLMESEEAAYDLEVCRLHMDNALPEATCTTRLDICVSICRIQWKRKKGAVQFFRKDDFLHDPINGKLLSNIRGTFRAHSTLFGEEQATSEIDLSSPLNYGAPSSRLGLGTPRTPGAGGTTIRPRPDVHTKRKCEQLMLGDQTPMRPVISGMVIRTSGLMPEMREAFFQCHV